jgi:hypothetical protein
MSDTLSKIKNRTGEAIFTLAIYGDNIPSTEQTVRIKIGEEAEDIQFPQ